MAEARERESQSRFPEARRQCSAFRPGISSKPKTSEERQAATDSARSSGAGKKASDVNRLRTEGSSPAE